MPVTLHWFLPTTGDSRTIVGVDERGGRSTHRAAGGGLRLPDLDYLAQVAHAAERLGFAGLLTPVGTYCEEAWLTTAALLRETRRLKFWWRSGPARSPRHSPPRWPRAISGSPADDCCSTS
jgi:alkanesulfonate monooxygenase